MSWRGCFDEGETAVSPCWGAIWAASSRSKAATRSVRAAIWAACAKFAPHCWQMVLPAGLSLPHVGHNWMLVMGSSFLQSANEWGGGVVLEKTAVLPHPHPMLPVTIIVPQINPKRDPLPMGRYIGNGSWTLAMSCTIKQHYSRHRFVYPLCKMV